MNQALHPTIAASLAPFMGSMGTFSNNPVADASDYNDKLADTFWTTITFMGIEFDVEVSNHTLRCNDIIGPGGEDWFYALSDDARNKIARIAIHQEGV